MKWPPSRSTLLLCLASGSAGYFMVGTIVGAHPDGAWLGFSAAIWAAWDNELIQERRRHQRRNRTPRQRGSESETPSDEDGERVDDEEGEDEEERV